MIRFLADLEVLVVSAEDVVEGLRGLLVAMAVTAPATRSQRRQGRTQSNASSSANRISDSKLYVRYMLPGFHEKKRP